MFNYIKQLLFVIINSKHEDYLSINKYSLFIEVFIFTPFPDLLHPISNKKFQWFLSHHYDLMVNHNWDPICSIIDVLKIF